ncbi:MAG: FKBP-type peptidyl-prolyl cis-trans isomerase [Euryarchaeota archaeon]|nr:FKBP-type peptidyl-prolyl cis-trans isomerase [Euryarchaeota archaeon]
MKKLIVSMILIGFIVTAGCLSDNEEKDGEEQDSVVEPGDVVAIYYIAWEKESGLVFETSIQKDANVTKETEFNGTQEHKPMNVTVKAANPAPGTITTLPGLEEALMGMKLGETKTVEIPPEKAYGLPDESQIKKINRVQDVPRYLKVPQTEEVPLSSLQHMVKGDITEGNTVELVGWWDVDILSIKDDMVTIKHHPTMDAEIHVRYGPYKVIEITEEKIKTEFNLEEGEKLEIPDFKGIVSEIKEETVLVRLVYRVGEGVQNTLPECEHCFKFGKVIEVTEEYVKIDFNFPLKGKTVIFKVKLVNIEKPE